ncbi:DgyrCDS12530 [Dimorphilus gyrociliatus]|uniref:DgyrCDS12530 n=1 Tax=Dimorphilus gyrociliatus TaxID=2664684 RepID=A0A7I8W8B1_9ANNE|nr:DgyrCDS12530 [Dimorphilus gyrociliatus]
MASSGDMCTDVTTMSEKEQNCPTEGICQQDEGMDIDAEETKKTLTEIQIEKIRSELSILDDRFPLAKQLLEKEIKILTEGNNFVELHNDKPHDHSVCIIVPIKENPEFPYIGNLLGKRGNTLQEIQRQTGTKITILGEGSIKDKEKEELFKKQGNSDKLLGPLHLEVRCLDLAENAYRRISMAINILKHFLHPATCKRTQANLFAGKDPLLPSCTPPSTPSRSQARGFGPRAHNTRGRGCNGPNPLAFISAVLQAAAPSGSQFYGGNNENGGCWPNEQDTSIDVRRGGRPGRSHPYTRGRGFEGRASFNPVSKPF